jgi:hypothetical protein
MTAAPPSACLLFALRVKGCCARVRTKGSMIGPCITRQQELQSQTMDPTEAPLSQKKSRADGNMTGLAGELFVAAELLKRGLQTSITFGNTKRIDLFAHNSNTGEDFTIQVKTLRTKNFYPLHEIRPDHVYVFVLLNKPGDAVQYFIAHGKRLLAEPDRFSYKDPKFSGIYWKTLAEFEGAWKTFGL